VPNIVMIKSRRMVKGNVISMEENRNWWRISHLWFRASSIYYINKPTWFNFMQLHLFFTAIHSTCFGRPPHPSSGVQLNCSYSHRYIFFEKDLLLW
jgi:hypothetical protein